MKRRSQDEWRELVALQATSGVSAQQFCEEHGISPSYFSLRKQQLNARESVKPFVRVTGDTPKRFNTTQDALVLHQGHCSLHFAVLPEPGWLAQYLSALT